MEDFDELKDKFARKLIKERKDLTISDVMTLIQPLAAEGVTCEPQLWTELANVILSTDLSKFTLQDLLNLSWSFGKVQMDLPADEDGNNFGRQADFWKKIIERGFAAEFREMKDNDYRSENVLPVLSKICVAL